MSKPLGSTVIAGLVGDRVVTWDDRIIDHDPGFHMHDASVTAALTIRDTSAHRSGLPDHAGDLLEDMGYDRAEVLRRRRVQGCRDIVGNALRRAAVSAIGHECHEVPPVGFPGAPQSRARSRRTPPLANVVYLGTYANDFCGKLELVVQDGKLTMRQGPNKSAYPLTRYDHDRLYYETAGENAVSWSGVTFTVGVDGNAAGVVVENLNQDGLGMFTRISDK
ncbi:MAG: serine hydrolase [Nitrospira sp.]|nr:serine hydrolase [Nitrospira sp.]